MPTYSYKCTQCDNAFDIQQSFSDPSLTQCPACSGVLRKVFGVVGVTFNGSGFYRTDSRAGAKSGGKSSASSSDSKSGNAGSGSGSSASGSGSSGSSNAGSGSSSNSGASSSGSSGSSSGSKAPAA